MANPTAQPSQPPRLCRQLSESYARVETLTTEAPNNAVKAEALSVFLGKRRLLSEVDLTIAEQMHVNKTTGPSGDVRIVKSGTSYGLVGPNGCGKSTLLKLIASRRIPVPATWDVFLLSQHLPEALDRPPVAEILAADLRLQSLLTAKAELELQMQDSNASAGVLQEVVGSLFQVQQELSKWDGAEHDINGILTALGFRVSETSGAVGAAPLVTTSMKQLSGGWRMKVELAKALWLKPRLLLLDEPTNHLDFHAVEWLKGKLEEYPHTTIIVSHDVSFLHETCREILWMKDLKLESMPRDLVSQEDLLGMLRQRPLKFSFRVPETDHPSFHGLSLHGIEFSYPVKDETSSSQLFRVKGTVRFSGTSRCVLLGKNGSGKSTFLDMCVGKLSPRRGRVDRTPDLKIGHYSQLTEELEPFLQDTAAEYLVRKCFVELSAHSGSTRSSRLLSALASNEEQKEDNQSAKVSKKGRASQIQTQKRLLEIARSVLSNFGFENDVAVTVPIEHLSGGQKACLKFAVLSMTPSHILLLDEPTNHLDAEACAALAKGLSEFEGGIVAVTHDDLLIYRLIHCNWSTSELLTCQCGCLRKEVGFSSQCLSTLKDQVRQAEVESMTADVKQMSKVTTLPVTKSQSTCKGCLPPWLAKVPSRRDVGKLAAPADLDIPLEAAALPASAQETVGETAYVIDYQMKVGICGNEQSTSQQIHQRSGSTKSSNKHLVPQTFTSTSQPTAVGHDSAIRSWEDLADDDEAEHLSSASTHCSDVSDSEHTVKQKKTKCLECLTTGSSRAQAVHCGNSRFAVESRPPDKSPTRETCSAKSRRQPRIS